MWKAGNLRLIGATTYNPFFYVNSALVSRSQVFQLEPLRVEQLEELIDRALADKERGLGNYTVKIDKDARRHLAKLSDGDARKCLNALEIGVLTTPPDSRGVIHFTLTVAEESIQQKAVVYDRAGDAHYDTISAFIKSMRASDEKGAMYWLAKMLHAGEDFRFIARRIVIFASEDVGLADPEALPLAIATQQAVEFVGMPEARIPLAHAVAYMCRAKKSREAYDALNAATEKIETEQTKRVPEHLKNKHFPVNPEDNWPSSCVIPLRNESCWILAAYVDFPAVREPLKQQFRAALHRSQNNDQTKHKKFARLLTALGPSLSDSSSTPWSTLTLLRLVWLI